MSKSFVSTLGYAISMPLTEFLSTLKQTAISNLSFPLVEKSYAKPPSVVKPEINAGFDVQIDSYAPFRTDRPVRVPGSRRLGRNRGRRARGRTLFESPSPSQPIARPRSNEAQKLHQNCAKKGNNILG